MGNVRRIYVEKKAPFAVKAKELKGDLKNYLNLKTIEDVRIFIRYDVEHISDEVFERAVSGGDCGSGKRTCVFRGISAGAV